jgi:hypothetical protein
MDPCPTLSPLQQQILAHHLRAEILQLVVHFQNCGGILPIPNADLALAWAFLPNQNVHSTRSTGDVQNVKTDVSTHNGPDAAEATSAAGPPGGNGAVHIDSWVSFKQPSMPPSEVNRPPTTVPRPKSAPSAQTARVSSANAASSSRTSTPVSSSDTQSPATSTDDTSSSRDRKQVVLTADLLLSRGNIQLVDTLLKLGTTDCRSATPVATIIKSIQTKLRNNLPRKKYIKSRLQIKAMAMFHDHWKAVRSMSRTC